MFLTFGYQQLFRAEIFHRFGRTYHQRRLSNKPTVLSVFKQQLWQRCIVNVKRHLHRGFLLFVDIDDTVIAVITCWERRSETGKNDVSRISGSISYYIVSYSCDIAWEMLNQLCSSGLTWNFCTKFALSYWGIVVAPQAVSFVAYVNWRWEAVNGVISKNACCSFYIGRNWSMLIY